MKIVNFVVLIAALIAVHATSVVATDDLTAPPQGASSVTAAAPPPPIRSPAGVDANVLESPATTPHVTLMGDPGPLGDLYRKLTSARTLAEIEACKTPETLAQLFLALKQVAHYIQPPRSSGGGSGRPKPAPVSGPTPLSSRAGPGGLPGVIADDDHALASPGGGSEEDADNDGDSGSNTHPLPSPKGGEGEDDENQAPPSPSKKQRKD